MCPKNAETFLMFNVAYDNEEVNDFKDISSHPENVLSTNSSSKPANRAIPFGDSETSLVSK